MKARNNNRVKKDAYETKREREREVVFPRLLFTEESVSVGGKRAWVVLPLILSKIPQNEQRVPSLDR